MPKTKKYLHTETFFENQGWKPFAFQKKVWKHYLDGYSGLINAPTGSGKTYSIWCGIVQENLNKSKNPSQKPKKLQAIWISPIRALTEEIAASAKRFCESLNLEWEIGIRTGDTDSTIKQKQLRNMPNLLITTPETLHILLASKKYPDLFSDLKCVVVDEWHELLGSKRGVQVELALSRLKALRKKLKIWGISATIGNLDEALEVLLGRGEQIKKSIMIGSNIKKKYEVISVLPDEVEKFPWAGHLGINMLPKIIPIINDNESTLIFTNTRAQCEIWFQQLMEHYPEFAGLVAMHHGSIAKKTRNWVEQALHEKRLKAVVCTSSLDLGVDFRPVDAVIQIGGPKGIARFMQRAGRSGHRPGETSKIYFVPTHSLELLEAAGLREAINEGKIESRDPYVRSFDVLIQYLVTLAVGSGFFPEEIQSEIKSTYSFESMNDEEWEEVLTFIVSGGKTLGNYEEYKKVEIDEDGRYLVNNRGIARRHRLSIGTIVSDAMLSVRFIGGGRLGVIEEWFVSKLNPGDTFWFSGRNLEFVQLKDMSVLVKRSNKNTGLVPSWQGGRMSLSSNMSKMLRKKINEATKGIIYDVELRKIVPLMDLQKRVSILPKEDELLIETTKTREGFHLFVYPFDGRYVHEGLASLLAWRISKLKPISFSIAFNDYGFELLSADEIPVDEVVKLKLLSAKNLQDDLFQSINSAELAKRRFRDIGVISGMVFGGFPGNFKQDKHLQSSTGLIFDVLTKYEPESILLREAYEEVFTNMIQEPRLRETLERIESQNIRVIPTKKPSPLSFPILVDRLREKVSSEKLVDRVKKMQIQFVK